MSNLQEFIDSGILEMYVLGNTTQEESLEVDKMMRIYPEIREEIEQISEVLERLALENAEQPEPTVKPFLLASLDYMSRLEAGELPADPPALHEGSQISDYDEWLNRSDLQLNEELDGFYAHIIGHKPEVLTAIVWLEHGAPGEVHHNEFERFLIVEGSCEITIGEQMHSLNPGSFLSIPLHISHNVRVTSQTPCKLILQRVAA